MSKSRRRRPKYRRRLTGKLSRTVRERARPTNEQRLRMALPEALAVRPDTDVRVDGVVFWLPVPEGQRPRAVLETALLILARAGFRPWTVPALSADFRRWTVWVEYLGTSEPPTNPWVERMSRPVRADDTRRTPRVPVWAGGDA